MSTLAFYRAQAKTQQAAADGSTLEKARARHQEAADSWAIFAERLEKRIALRRKLANVRAIAMPSENPDRGRASR